MNQKAEKCVGLNRLSASVRIWTYEFVMENDKTISFSLNRLSASVRSWTGEVEDMIAITPDSLNRLSASVRIWTLEMRKDLNDNGFGYVLIAFRLQSEFGL